MNIFRKWQDRFMDAFFRELCSAIRQAMIDEGAYSLCIGESK